MQFNLKLEEELKERHFNSITREEIEVDLGIIEAKTWPRRYKAHKYWGKKPANIVSDYIRYFTNPNDLVVDPFSGSGVTAIEAAIIGRKSNGFDINPFPHFLSQTLSEPCDPVEFERAASLVLEDARSKAEHLYQTKCIDCGAPAIVRSYAYEKDHMVRVIFDCEQCGFKGDKSPDTQDQELARLELNIDVPFPDEEMYFGWEMQKLKKHNVTRWQDILTKRNLFYCAHLMDGIQKIKDERIRNWLLITFSSFLAQATRMIGDFRGKAGGPSWKINCYWLPDLWQELNPGKYFYNRIAKSKAAIIELAQSADVLVNANFSQEDSRSLPLEDETVDYIFTDPPYGGEGIQYGELCYLWCLWLGLIPNLEQEIAYNPYRNLSQVDYDSGLKSSFAEAYRVLKPGRWMTVTFANKDPVVWEGLMAACQEAGFTLVTVIPMKRSAPSLTETTMTRAPKADLILTFQKRDDVTSTTMDDKETGPYVLRDRIMHLLPLMNERGEKISENSMYDRVTIDWFSWFYSAKEKPTAEKPTLERIRKELQAFEEL